MSTSVMDVTPAQTVAQAQEEVDRLHRSGAMTLIALAAFWGIAAALYEWGSPLAGQIALLIGSLAAHPVAWLILKLAGGPAMAPRSNKLTPLFYQVSLIPLVVTLGAMALADARPDAFFAASMLGLSAAFLPTATLYGRPLYLILAAVFAVLPIVGWVAAEPLLPWFGLLGVALLLVAGALMLRRLGGLGAAPRESTSLSDGVAPAAAGTAGAAGAASATAPALDEDDADAGAAGNATTPLSPRPSSDAPWDQSAPETPAAPAEDPFAQAAPARPGEAPTSGLDDVDDTFGTPPGTHQRPEA